MLSWFAGSPPNVVVEVKKRELDGDETTLGTMTFVTPNGYLELAIDEELAAGDCLIFTQLEYEYGPAASGFAITITLEPAA